MKKNIRNLLFGLAVMLVQAGQSVPLMASGPEKASPPVAEAAADTLGDDTRRRFDYFFLEALRMQGKGENDAAFELLAHCLAMDPSSAPAQYQMGQSYLSLKQMPAAIKAMETAAAADPANYWYSIALVNLYLRQDSLDRAASLLEDMSVRFTGKLDPLYVLLDIYNKRKDYSKAISVLERFEERMGKNEQITMEKSRVYFSMGEDKRALREIEGLVKEYPKDLRYKVVLGDAYMQKGKRRDAYKLYRQVLDEEPDNAMAMYSLADYYELTGQQEEYERQLDSLLLNRKVSPDIKLQVMRQLIVRNEREDGDSLKIMGLFDRVIAQDLGDPQIPMLYAQYLLSKGLDKEALPVVRMVLDIDPTNTAARMMLLGEAIRTEDTAGLISLCEAGVETNPDMLEFYFYLAIGYNQEERTDDVLEVCRKALEHVTAGSRKNMVSDFYTIMGDAFFSKGMSGEAYAAYDNALKYNPDNIGALNNYAYYLSLERKDLDKAEEMSYKTIKAEPGNPTYLDTYAWILFEKGNYAEARIYIDDAMVDDGAKSPDVVEHCGDIYYMTGDVDKAVGFWQQALDLGSQSETLPEKIRQRRYISKEEHAEDR